MAPLGNRQFVFLEIPAGIPLEISPTITIGENIPKELLNFQSNVFKEVPEKFLRNFRLNSF